MTDCPNCVAASERDWHGFTGDCMVCQARRIARGPVCHAAARAGVITPDYRAELEAVGGEHWLSVHALVRAWQQGERPEWEPQP